MRWKWEKEAHVISFEAFSSDVNNYGDIERNTRN